MLLCSYIIEQGCFLFIKMHQFLERYGFIDSEILCRKSSWLVIRSWCGFVLEMLWIDFSLMWSVLNWTGQRLLQSLKSEPVSKRTLWQLYEKHLTETTLHVFDLSVIHLRHNAINRWHLHDYSILNFKAIYSSIVIVFYIAKALIQITRKRKHKNCVIKHKVPIMIEK